MPLPASGRDARASVGRRPRNRKVFLSFIVAGVLVLFVVLGIAPRLHRQTELRAMVEALQSSHPKVTVASVEQAPAISSLTLPATVRAFLDTPLYARTNGYLQRYLVEIGDHVQKGQLLGEIATPEIDEELRQARATLKRALATLDQAGTNLALARTSMERWKSLIPEQAVSQQEMDERLTAYEAQQAVLRAAEENVRANEANVKRIEELQSFQRLTAPFSGVITARNVDTGALISAGSGGAGVRELFRIAETDPLRIYVYVPQTFVPYVQPGQAAAVLIRELPGQRFDGRVIRHAGALDPASRTLLTEVQLSNPKGIIFPGMYAEVEFEISRTAPPLMIPANALVIRADGPQVAVLDDKNRIRIHKVELGRDYGPQVEIVSGLEPGEKVVTTLSDAIREGVLVEPRHSEDSTKGTRATGPTSR